MKPKSIRPALRDRGTSLSTGFTLIELLVTITLIVALAALTVLIVSKIRQNAHQANALTSLRQIAAISTAYSQENNGDINTLRWVGDPKEGGGGSWVKNSFWGRLQPYLFPDVSLNDQKKLKEELSQRLESVFNCKDASTMDGTLLHGAKIYHDGSGLPVALGFNNNLHKWGEFLKVGKFSDPTSVIYATYGYGFFDVQDGQMYVPTPADSSKPSCNIYYFKDRKALAAFLDGHVELLPAPMPDRRFE